MQNSRQTSANCLVLSARCQDLNKICAKESLEPILVVSVESLSYEIIQVYRSVAVSKSFDPVFQEPICLEQPLSSLLSVILQVYNNDQILIGKSKLMSADLLGKSVLEARLAKNFGMKLKSDAKIILTRQNLPSKLRTTCMQFSCQKIDQSLWTAIFCNNCYYFRLYQLSSKKQAMLYQSEKIKGPPYSWESFVIHQRKKSTTILKIQLLCQDQSQQPEVVGCGELNTDSLNGQKELIIKNQSSKLATFSIEKYEASQIQPFESYFSRGLKIKPMLGIDFTASNGSYISPKSLHHIYKGDNIYQKTVEWIFNIFTPYNNSTSIPYYAVGTKVKHPDIFTGKVVQDCFPLNGNKNDHQIADLEQFHLQYKKLLPCMQFSGPFKLEKILIQAKELSESERKKGCFTVLIVINDGTVGDTEIAKKRLEELANYPFFMIAIGIKQAQYKELKEIVKVEANRTSLDGKIIRRKLAAFTMADDKYRMGIVLQTMMCSIAQYMDYQFKKSSEKYGVIAVQQLQKEVASQTTVE